METLLELLVVSAPDLFVVYQYKLKNHAHVVMACHMIRVGVLYVQQQHCSNKHTRPRTPTYYYRRYLSPLTHKHRERERERAHNFRTLIIPQSQEKSWWSPPTPPSSSSMITRSTSWFLTFSRMTSSYIVGWSCCCNYSVAVVYRNSYVYYFEKKMKLSSST